jgi:integrase
MSVRVIKGQLYIDFYCFSPAGKKLRCRERLNKQDNVRNRKWADTQEKAIAYALEHGRFSYLEFFPYGSKAHLFRQGKGDTTLNEFWPGWMDKKYKRSVRNNTLKGWQNAFDNHIGPNMGHYLVSQITDDQVLELRFILTNLRDADGNRRLADSTINDKIIKPLCMCLKNAFEMKMTSAYPCAGIGRLAEIPPEIYPLSFDELHHFLGFLKENYPEEHDMYFVWSRQGFRPGELCALKWERIDFFNKKTMVRETLHEDRSEGPPKTANSVRDVDMTVAVFEAYKRQEARTSMAGPYVFMTRKHNAWTAPNLRSRFKFLLRRAGIRVRAPKQLRHTFATLHIGAGENITWVSKMLGHADVVITLKKYNRFIPNLTGRDGSAFETVYNSWATVAQTEGKQGQNRAISRQHRNKK